MFTLASSGIAEVPTASLEDWVALHLLPGLGPILTHRCLERFGDPGTIAWRVPVQALQQVPGFGAVSAGAIVAARRELRAGVEREIRLAEKRGIRLVQFGSPIYPAALETLPDPPILLYMCGEMPEAVARIAVVGSRRATAYGRRIATGLAMGLAQRRVEVVSGGARGIDTCAHVGALEAGGRTVAVLGSGFLRLYPAENAELFDRIAASGAVVSEFPLEADPLPQNFPRRNRLISGLSAAVVVVEAAEKSGSLTTAGHALEQGREVMAVPGLVSSDQSVGCHRLIQQGAKLVQRVDDILEELSPMYRAAAGPGPAPPGARAPDSEGLPADEAAVLALLCDPEPLQLDQLADAAPFGIGRLQAALFGLEVRGLVEQLPGRYYLSRLRKEA